MLSEISCCLLNLSINWEVFTLAFYRSWLKRAATLDTWDNKNCKSCQIVQCHEFRYVLSWHVALVHMNQYSMASLTVVVVDNTQSWNFGMGIAPPRMHPCHRGLPKCIIDIVLTISPTYIHISVSPFAICHCSSPLHKRYVGLSLCLVCHWRVHKKGL